MLESKFNTQLDKDIEDLFPGAFILQNDSRVVQGIPDKLVLWRRNWGMLESKAWAGARRQPNQEYYVDLFDDMSFGRFVSPDNVEDVLYDLQRAWNPSRHSRVSQRKQLPLGELRRR